MIVFMPTECSQKRGYEAFAEAGPYRNIAQMRIIAVIALIDGCISMAAAKIGDPP